MSGQFRLERNKLLSNDYLYYDAVIYNPGPFHTWAEFKVNLQDALLQDASEYKMSIVRFEVPGYELPLFVFDEGTYDVALEYKGVTYSVDVKYYPTVDVSPAAPNQEYYYSVYDYQTFITMINTALHTAFALMKADQPGVPATQPPYLTYDAATTLFTMVAPKEYASNLANPIEITFNQTLFTFFESFESYGIPEVFPSTEPRVRFTIQDFGYNQVSTHIPELSPWSAYTTYAIGDLVSYLGTNYIALTATNLNNNPATTIGVNWNAYTLANGNPSGWDSAVSYNIGDIVMYAGATYVSLVNPNLNNIPTATLGTDWNTTTATLAYKSVQEFSALSNWNDPKALVFTTQSIPVVPEYLPVQSGSNQQGAANYLNIISDFVITTPVGPEVRSIFVYNPTAEYRWISLNSQKPLNQIDFKLWWLDQQQVLHPMYVHPKISITVKFLFQRLRDHDDKR